MNRKSSPRQRQARHPRKFKALVMERLEDRRLMAAEGLWPDGAPRGEFRFVVDETLRPEVAVLPGRAQEAERPVAVVASPDGSRDEFVANEVILYAPSQEILRGFLDRYNGEILDDGTLPAEPGRRGSPSTGSLKDYYLVRVNLERADLTGLERLMTERQRTGTYRYGSQQALQLNAILAQEWSRGIHVTPNTLFEAQSPAHVLSGTEEALAGNRHFNAFEWEFLNDPELQVTRAWQYLDLLDLGNVKTRVAVLDSGFSKNDDLPSNVLQFDFADDDNDAMGILPGSSAAHNYHGTGSASTAVARMDNQFGAAGTGAPVAEPILFRIANSYNSDGWTMARAIDTAVAWNAQVINISWIHEKGNWGTTWQNTAQADTVLETAVKNAIAKNVVVVAAAGNDEQDLSTRVAWPCEIEGVICVGAIDPASKDAIRPATWGWGSNYGSEIDIWAPGASVWTSPNPDTTGGLHMFGGTSCASPYVAGVAALMKAIDPGLTPAEVQSFLRQTANNSTDARVQAAGFINAYAAVKKVAMEAGLSPKPDAYEAGTTGTNNSAATATTWTAGGVGSIGGSKVYNFPELAATIVPMEADYFTFTTTEYVQAQLTLRYEDVQTPGNALTVLLDNYGGTDQAGTVIVNRGLQPGKHTVRIMGANTTGTRAVESINAYTLGLRLVGAIAPDRFDDQTPAAEPRNDSVAAAAVIPDIVESGSCLTHSVSVDDLNHDKVGDIDYFTVQLGPKAINHPSPNAPGYAPSEFRVVVSPKYQVGAHRDFQIVVYDEKGEAIQTEVGKCLVLEDPYAKFPSGKITFSVQDPLGHNFYDLGLGYHLAGVYKSFPKPLYKPPFPRWDIPIGPQIRGARVVVDPIAELTDRLNRECGFYNPTGGDFVTGKLRMQEKWFSGSDGQQYYLLPNGQLYRSPEGGRGRLVATLDATYHADPWRLLEARPSGAPEDAKVYLESGQLVVEPRAGFSGTLKIRLSTESGEETTLITHVSDGRLLATGNEAGEVNDRFVLRQSPWDPDVVEVLRNNRVHAAARYDELREILIDAGAGSDHVTLQDLRPDVPITVRGGSGDDRFFFDATTCPPIVSGRATAVFDGGEGADLAVLTGSLGNDVATLSPTRACLTSDAFTVNVLNATRTTIYGGGGNDQARLYDSSEGDTLVATPERVTLAGAGIVNLVEGFRTVIAIADAGGADVAKLYDSRGNDTFTASPAVAELSGRGYRNVAGGFETVYAYATARGVDTAYLHDSAGNDTVVAAPRSVKLAGPGFVNVAQSFDAVYANAKAGGADRAFVYDSSGDDRFEGGPNLSRISGPGYVTQLEAFDRVYANARYGGNDTAVLTDSTGNDRLDARDNWAQLQDVRAAIFCCRAIGFDQVKVASTLGRDARRTLATLDFLLETTGSWREA